MKAALDETDSRRGIQMEYNKKHGITPKSVKKAVFAEVGDRDDKTDSKRRFVYDKSGGVMDAASLRKEIKSMTIKMKKHAENLEFEEAGKLRDSIRRMEEDLLLLE